MPTGHASTQVGFGALQAAHRFLLGQGFGVAEIDFHEIRGPHARRLLRHRLPGDLHAIFDRHGFGGFLFGVHGYLHLRTATHWLALRLQLLIGGALELVERLFFLVAIHVVALARARRNRRDAASNSGPSTQANSLLPSTRTRHPPHMPVPSTMIEFRLTTVGMCSLRVTSATARIIGIGPTASTRSIFTPLSMSCLQLVGDEALVAVGAVVGGDHEHVADRAHLVFEDHQILAARADDGDDFVPACFSAAVVG